MAMDVCTFDIGGFTVGLVSKNAIKLEYGYKPLASFSLPSVFLEIRHNHLPEYCHQHLKRVFSTPTYAILRNEKEYFFYFYRHLQKNPYKVLQIDTSLKKGIIYLKSDREIVWEFPLDQLLFMFLLSQNCGFLIHGLGLNYKGKGLVFAGQSGSGKTTLARQFDKDSKAKILNDDRIIIRKQKSSFYLYGTPWPGDFGEFNLESAELKKLFFLRKDSRCKIKRLKSEEAIAHLVRCSFLPFWDKEKIETTLSLFADFVSWVACYEFSFSLTKKYHLSDFLLRDVP